MTNVSGTTHRTLFTVIQTTNAEGHSFCQVDWHPDILAYVDEDGEDTDPLIDVAEELLAREAGQPDADDEQ